MTRPTMSFAEALDHTRGGTAVLTFTDNQWILVYAPNAIVKRKRWAIEWGMAPNDVVQPLVDACDAADTAMNNGQYLLDTSTLSYASTRAVVWLRAYQRNNPIDS